MNPDWAGKAESGDPQAIIVSEYESPDGKIQTGTWESSTGTWMLDYGDWEYCHVLEGRFVITPLGGEPTEYSAGDVFVLEPGFKGTLKVLARTRKHFVYMTVANGAAAGNGSDS